MLQIKRGGGVSNELHVIFGGGQVGIGVKIRNAF
jgi:hypothetical protein